MGKGLFINLVVLTALLTGSCALAAPSPGLTTILGNDEPAYPARLAAVKALSKSLSKEEIAVLYGFLERKSGEDKSLPGELNALKNDVVNVLKMQKVMPLDLAGHLISMYGDHSHDEVWRDYCIQHLGDIYTEISDEGDKEKAFHALWAALDERQGSIPGTGLIALFNLCGQKGFEKDRISTKALEMVSASDYGEPAKITALQICAKLGEKAVLPDARKLAASGAVPIRMSAMACLGTLGDKSDLELLKASGGSADVRLRTASQAAIKKLSAKRAQE